MNIKCPHCGTEYEVEKKDMYRYTKCEVCGNGFVVGAMTSLLAETSSHPVPSVTCLGVRMPEQQARISTVSSSQAPQKIRNTNVREVRNDEPFLRQINIYGYREKFAGNKNPVKVSSDSGTWEVPYRGNVTITARVNERLLFSFAGPWGTIKDTELVVGDIKNIVLALNRKDWSIRAKKTNDVRQIIESNNRKDTLRLIKGVGILGLLIFPGLWAANEKWGLCVKISDMFDDTPVDYLERAYEPSYLRNRSDGEKMIDDAYKSQYGLDFTSGWYTKCPRCGTKLTPPSERKGQKVSCIECKHTWKYK